MRRTENGRGTSAKTGTDLMKDKKDTLIGNLRGSLTKAVEQEETIQGDK